MLIILTAISWILYLFSAQLNSITELSLAEDTTLFVTKNTLRLTGILDILTPVLFIVFSLSLYFSDYPSPIFQWIITIVIANTIGEILLILFFNKKTIIVINSILSPLMAIIVVLPFWLIAQINIIWVYKILIMIPVFFIYFSMVAPYLVVLIAFFSILVSFLIFPLIFIEKWIRGLQ